MHKYFIGFTTTIYISLLYYHSKVAMLITFQRYFNCIETKRDWQSSFIGLQIYLFFLLKDIYLYNKYIYYGKKDKYIYIYAQTMAYSHGGATMWVNVCTTPLHTVKLLKLRLASWQLSQQLMFIYMVDRWVGDMDYIYVHIKSSF